MASWEPLGGDFKGTPGACSWGPNRLDVFVRGRDDACWHKWFDGGWSEWENLGGGFSSDLFATCWADGRIDVFGRGLDNACWHKWFDGAWSGWESLGGGFNGALTACAWAPGRLDVFGRGTDDACWHKWFDGTWSGWENLGGGFSADLSAASWADGRIDVFGRGLDDACWHKWFDGSWSGWESLGGGFKGAPGACSWGPGRLDVFGRGMDDACWHKWYDGAWSDWESLGGGFTSDLSAASWADGRIDVFGRGLDEALWHTWFDGTWSGTVVEAPKAALSTFRINVFDVLRLAPQQLPRFSEAGSDALRAAPLGVGVSEDGRRWQTLVGWLNPAPDGLAATVLCRKTGLTIRLEAAGDAGASPLPFGADSPKATLRWATGQGAERQVHERPMTCVVDAAARTTQVVVDFADADDYGATVKVLSDSASDVAVVLAASHQYLIVGPPEPGGGGGGPRPRPWPLPLPWKLAERLRDRRPVLVRDHRDPGRIRDHRTQPRISAAVPAIRRVTAAGTTLGRATLGRVLARARPTVQPAAVPAAAAVATPIFGESLLVGRDLVAARSVSAALRRDETLVRAIRRSTGDLRRVWTVPELAQPGQPSISSGVVESAVTLPVHRPQTDVAVYPDLPRVAHGGWDQVPGRGDAAPLHFKDSPRADVFFFLPTEFRLGFYRGIDESGAADLPPLRVTQYVGDDGAYRVKVSLVAVPYISDGDRDALSRYVREVVLRQTLPFVELEPRSGLRATFVSELTAGAAADQSPFPESIEFSTEEVTPDRRLELLFDMESMHYGIFCELLKKGIRGRIRLEDEGLQSTIDVSLRLDRLSTNRVALEAEGFGAAPAPAGADPSEEAGEPPAPQRRLKLRNELGHPVRLRSVTVTCLDRGPMPGMVFDAERLDLLAEERVLDPGGTEGATVALDVAPSRIGVWDDTVVHLGELRVDAGTPQEWLDRVHRDSSLQPQRRKVEVTTVAPSGAARSVQVVRLQVFAPGEAAARSDLDAAPGGTVELVLEQTLAELAAAGTARPAFALEFASLYDDGHLSLPQRVEIGPTTRELTVPILIEAPGATFAVEHAVPGAAATTSDGLDREAAAALIERLRGEGARWRVFARRPTPPPDAGPAPEPPPAPPPGP